MVGRGELTDTAWATLAPLLPDNGQRGQQWRDHRQVIDGIPWKLCTGAPWRDLPERYGPWRTVYSRFTRWQRDGTWDRLLAHVQTKSDAAASVDRRPRSCRLGPAPAAPAFRQAQAPTSAP